MKHFRQKNGMTACGRPSSNHRTVTTLEETQCQVCRKTVTRFPNLETSWSAR